MHITIQGLAIYIVALACGIFSFLVAHQAYWYDWTGVFVALQAIYLSTLPYALERRGIFTPYMLRIGIALFACATLVLGEMADFYNQFTWWDLVLHGTASAGLTVIGFIVITVTSHDRHVRSTPFLTSALAASFALSLSVLWEIYEFFVDLSFVTRSPMQPSNFDTMTDLIVSVVGALTIAIFGYRYIRWQERGIVGGIIHEGRVRNRRWL